MSTKRKFSPSGIEPGLKKQKTPVHEYFGEQTQFQRSIDLQLKHYVSQKRQKQREQSAHALKEFCDGEQSYLNVVRHLKNQLIPWIHETAESMSFETEPYAKLGFDQASLEQAHNALFYIEENSAQIESAFKNLFESCTYEVNLNNKRARYMRETYGTLQRNAVADLMALNTLLPEYFKALDHCVDFYDKHADRLRKCERNLLNTVKDEKGMTVAMEARDTNFKVNNQHNGLDSLFIKLNQRPMQYGLILKEILNNMDSSEPLYPSIKLFQENITGLTHHLNKVQEYKQHREQAKKEYRAARKIKLPKDLPHYLKNWLDFSKKKFPRELVRIGFSDNLHQARTDRDQLVQAAEYFTGHQEDIVALVNAMKQHKRNCSIGVRLNKTRQQTALQNNLKTSRRYRRWHNSFYANLSEIYLLSEKIGLDDLLKNIQTMAAVRDFDVDGLYETFYEALNFLKDNLNEMRDQVFNTHHFKEQAFYGLPQDMSILFDARAPMKLDDYMESLPTYNAMRM